MIRARRTLRHDILRTGTKARAAMYGWVPVTVGLIVFLAVLYVAAALYSCGPYLSGTGPILETNLNDGSVVSSAQARKDSEASKTTSSEKSSKRGDGTGSDAGSKYGSDGRIVWHHAVVRRGRLQELFIPSPAPTRDVLGIETDVRVHRGRLVLNHNPMMPLFPPYAITGTLTLDDMVQFIGEKKEALLKGYRQVVLKLDCKELAVAELLSLPSSYPWAAANDNPLVDNNENFSAKSSLSGLSADTRNAIATTVDGVLGLGKIQPARSTSPSLPPPASSSPSSSSSFSSPTAEVWVHGDFAAHPSLFSTTFAHTPARLLSRLLALYPVLSIGLKWPDNLDHVFWSDEGLEPMADSAIAAVEGLTHRDTIAALAAGRKRITLCLRWPQLLSESAIVVANRLVATVEKAIDAKAASIGIDPRGFDRDRPSPSTKADNDIQRTKEPAQKRHRVFVTVWKKSKDKKMGAADFAWLEQRLPGVTIDASGQTPVRAP